MTDNELARLVAAVPTDGILLIDEFDKQLKAMRSNRRVALTMGGLNSAIDGAQRMSFGSIVIIISNADPATYLSTHEYAELCRPGRIDSVHHLTRCITGPSVPVIVNKSVFVEPLVVDVDDDKKTSIHELTSHPAHQEEVELDEIELDEILLNRGCLNRRKPHNRTERMTND